MSTLYGADGEPCPSCGSPLAGDQRYCLSCGVRRPGVRLPVPEPITAVEVIDAHPVRVSLPVPSTVGGWLRDNAAGLIALTCLLLAMLIGVLLGHWSHGEDAAATVGPPQVISVGAAPAAATAPAAVPSATIPTTPGPRPSTAKGVKKAASGSPTPRKTKAANPSLNKLKNLSGKEYQKQVDKLGKKISTGGAPPPVDKSKPAAGGADFQTIG